MNNVIALAGNPNVGKSTIFNALTGMNQHTGNWPGKTIEKAEGKFIFNDQTYTLIDLPGTYSLFAHSLEEEIARDFICFQETKCVVVVCDATCLERNLNLVLQILEITNKVVVCINLMDEAHKKHIHIDVDALQKYLQVPVVATSARSKKGLLDLQEAIGQCSNTSGYFTCYPEAIEKAIVPLAKALPELDKPQKRWIALRMLEDYHNDTLSNFLYAYQKDETIRAVLLQSKMRLHMSLYTSQKYEDTLVHTIVEDAQSIAQHCVYHEKGRRHWHDERIDKIVTSKKTGIPIMLLLLCVVFWITIVGANYPSAFLSDFLFGVEHQLDIWLTSLHVNPYLIDLLVHGMFRVLAWVVSVMLPPMAIFFPLFTLLEDLGYLPRIAFNLDHYFKKACTCGKQALTMCMGFGCNAVGVSGTRIIDSPRERLIAILTNNFVPCNGRFPTIITIITMFFITSNKGVFTSFASALMLTFVILIGVVLTLMISKLLSKTLLKGEASSFTLELPPYRKPQIVKVIIRSIFDRTLKVLGRAIVIAAPAGCIIWLLANIYIGEYSVLTTIANFLDPLGMLMGMDGVILLAFILGFPANEIVIPIMIMIYMASGNLIDLDNASLLALLVEQGWTWTTALCTMLFTLLHWPCSTTCLTIYKETRSVKWTFVAFILPTLVGVCTCIIIAFISRLL